MTVLTVLSISLNQYNCTNCDKSYWSYPRIIILQLYYWWSFDDERLFEYNMFVTSFWYLRYDILWDPLTPTLTTTVVLMVYPVMYRLGINYQHTSQTVGNNGHMHWICVSGFFTSVLVCKMKFQLQSVDNLPYLGFTDTKWHVCPVKQKVPQGLCWAYLINHNANIIPIAQSFEIPRSYNIVQPRC